MGSIFSRNSGSFCPEENCRYIFLSSIDGAKADTFLKNRRGCHGLEEESSHGIRAARFRIPSILNLLSNSNHLKPNSNAVEIAGRVAII